MTRRSLTTWTMGLCSLLQIPLSAAPVFAPPEQLTDGSQGFQLSRNPNGSMAFDSEGLLHITYWAGGFATSPSTPSFVYYQNWSSEGGWSARESIDDSFYNSGSGLVPYGGRHPSLAIAPNDTVWVAWHDHRHSNPDPPGNGIDNTEIYGDRRPAGGSFSSTDLRLTTTSASNFGDNGYLPRIVASSTGRISVLWYDFHVDGSISDIFVKHSDTNGVFDLSESVLSLRITDQEDRPGSGFSKEAYSIPDLAVDSSGDLFGIWTSGFSGSAPVYFAEVPSPAAITSESLIATASGSYFDPAKITIAPNDDVWVGYTSTVSAEQDVYIMRKPSSSSSFGAPIPVSAQPGVTEKAIDLEVDSSGIVHLTWIEGLAEKHVYYAQYDPVANQVRDKIQVSGDSANFQRVTLTLDQDDQPYLLFDTVELNSGDIWFASPAMPSFSSEWTYYQ